MLEVLSDIVCCTMMCVTEFFVGKKLTKSEKKITEVETIASIIILIIIQRILHDTTYNIINVLLTFLTNIIFFKVMFKLKNEEAVICCGIYTLILSVADILSGITLGMIYTVEMIRTDPIISIITNVIVMTICIIIVNIKRLNKIFNAFFKMSNKKRQIANGTFIILQVLVFILLAYNVSIAKHHDFKYIVSFVIEIILVIIAYIFIQEKIRYSQLRDEYSTLFGYVQNFEEWIERDQLNRHEYKNQLAVIRSITKDESVIKKINDLLDDNIKIKGDAVYKLKELPTGGLKGLMYYKVAIAQKQNVNIEVDVSLKRKSEFKKLNEHKIKVLSNLIGIYFDNAIEAALETEEKNVCLEVYEIKDGIKFVISNTFKRNENFDRRNERGVTSKGKGHGNGLYYANNLISKNNWLDASQEIIDNYYIQNIIIKN